MSQIHILDQREDVIVGHIDASQLLSDAHRKSLEDSIETYDFIALGNEDFSAFLDERNRIIIPDEDGSLREFVIFETDRYRDTEAHKVSVYAEASYLDLKKANVIYPNTFKGTASQHMSRALNDTGWSLGLVEVSGDKTLTVEKHISPYENIKRIAREFGGELRFRIEHDGRTVTGRYVDVLERIGDWRGREVEFGKDLDGIRRVEKQDVVTALLGLGPEREDGTRIEVLVEDDEALQRWGRVDRNGNLKHLIEAYEIESEREEMTVEEARRYTRTALDKRIDTHITYDTTIIDLEQVEGLEHLKLRFGDTIRIKDDYFNPPIYVEARIFEQTRSIITNDKVDIKLGDYVEYTEEQVNDMWEQLRHEIQVRLARLVIATITSTGGDVFKNGEGATDLLARTFVNGNEVDEDGTRYGYQWIKFDKDGIHDDSFNAVGQLLPVRYEDVDEKATFRVLISFDRDVVTTSEYTITTLSDGEKGADGKDGVDGKDGKSSYIHVRYSKNADGSNMTTDPTDAVYIGIVTTESPIAPSDKEAYEWSKIKGDDGVSGGKGEDGRTSYVHIKYSNDGGKSFTTNNGEDPGDWIGTYTDFNQADSNDVSKYTWAKVKGDKGDKGDTGPQGIPGQKGADGKTYYTWVKYADTPTSGMSDNPTGKDYIGLAYNKESPTMSTNYSDYTWSLFKGPQGIKGEPGEDGEPNYTWLKYADDEHGNGMSDNPDGKLYIGLAFNKKTATESNIASDYTWSLMPQNMYSGGTNLLRNSDMSIKKNRDDIGVPSHTTLDESSPSDFKGTFVRLRRDSVEGNEMFYCQVYGDKDISFIQGEEYTLTFLYIVPSIADSELTYTYIMRNDGANQRITLTKKEVVGTAFTSFTVYRAVFTFKPNWSDDNAWLMIGTRATSVGAAWLRFSNPQVMRGNMVEDWRAHPGDIDESIREVQTTADGKNSVFRQNTQPSTSGRKVGDVWFKSNADNKMYTFNGTRWVEAKFGEDAIIANSITANHIKSLDGLNVEDQFIVKDGNVTFSGRLQGADGVFTGTLRGGSVEQTGDKGKIVLDKDGFRKYDSSGRVRFEISNEDDVYQGFSASMVRFDKDFIIAHNAHGLGDAFIGWDHEHSYKDSYFFLSNPMGNITLDATEVSMAGATTKLGDLTFIRGRGANYGMHFDSGGGDSKKTSHVITSHTTKFHMVMYPQRWAGTDIFEIRSHDNKGSYQTNMKIDAQGRVSCPAWWSNTSSKATNARVSYDGSTANTTLFRVTSARKYKDDIKDVDVDPYLLLDVLPRMWKDKGDIERNAGDSSGVKYSYGMVADEVAEAGLSPYVDYMEGEIEGLQYERLWTLLVPIVKDLVEDNKMLKERLSDIEEVNKDE